MRRRKKEFDCVEMQHQGGARIYEIIKDMTPEEEAAYWAQRTEEMRRRIKAARQAAQRKSG